MTLGNSPRIMRAMTSRWGAMIWRRRCTSLWRLTTSGRTFLGFAEQDAVLERGQFGRQLVEGGLVVVEEDVEDLVGEQIGRARQGVALLLDAVAHDADAAQGLVVEGDQEIAADEGIELGGLEDVAAVDVVDGVDDHEDVVLVVVDLGPLGDGHAVLDGEGMEVEDGFEDGLVFLGRALFHVDPDLDVVVVEDHAQEIQGEVLVDQLALAEYEGANHIGFSTGNVHERLPFPGPENSAGMMHRAVAGGKEKPQREKRRLSPAVRGRGCQAGPGWTSGRENEAYFRSEMSDEPQSPITPEIVQLRMKIFLRSPLRRRLLARMMRLLDKVGGQQVLEMSGDDAISVAMRNAGGGGGANWTSLAVSETQAELLAEAGVERIHLAALPQLPFEEGAFDAVVASDMLEYVREAGRTDGGTPPGDAVQDPPDPARAAQAAHAGGAVPETLGPDRSHAADGARRASRRRSCSTC